MSQSVRLNNSRARDNPFTQSQIHTKKYLLCRFMPKNLYMSKFFCTFAAAKLQMALLLLSSA